LTRLGSVEAGGVQLGTNVDVGGSTAAVQFVITNPQTEARYVTIVMSTNILLGESRVVQMRTERNGTSFRIVNDLTHFQVFAKDYPLVVDVNTFWYGSASELATHTDQQISENFIYDGNSGAFALSWTNRLVPPRTRIVLSALMSWGEVSNPPSGSVDSSQLPPDNATMNWEANVSITGKIDVTSATVVTDIVVYLVVDGEIMQSFPLDATGGFTVSFSAAALKLSGGTHVFQIYAVDSVGAIASIASFSNEVLAPTAPQTLTPRPTGTPTASPSISASWGAIVDIPWREPYGFDTANEGVNQVTVGKIVIGIGIPIGVILILGFGFLIHRYQHAIRADMMEQLQSSSASELGSTGTGI
jgi:hypothetical protein